MSLNRRWTNSATAILCGLAAVELLLRAFRAEEHQFIIRVEVRLPVLLVAGQPAFAALGASRDKRNLFGAHRRSPPGSK
jgi:hypothetical protein